MASRAVGCGSCGLNWVRPAGVGDYERAAIESRPCPRCGAYTLTCVEPKPLKGRRRTTAGAVRGVVRPAA